MLKFIALASLAAAVTTAGAASLSLAADQLEPKGSAQVELLAGQPEGGVCPL